MCVSSGGCFSTNVLSGGKTSSEKIPSPFEKRIFLVLFLSLVVFLIYAIFGMGEER